MEFQEIFRGLPDQYGKFIDFAESQPKTVKEKR